VVLKRTHEGAGGEPRECVVSVGWGGEEKREAPEGVVQSHDVYKVSPGLSSSAAIGAFGESNDSWVEG
jgi:hypothetical protein